MKKIIFLAIVPLLVFQTISAQQVSPFKEGDRVVFLGNSITDGGRYHSFIWLYYMTRFPDMPLTIMNAGIGGDTAYDMNKRLDGDVFSKRPTVLVATFGMNDSGYFEYNWDGQEDFGEKKYQECYGNFKQMEKRFQGLPNTRIVMMGSSPYDETAKIEGNTALRGKNETMKRIVAFQKESAEKNGWEFFDLNQPMTEINQNGQQKDSTFTVCGNDRIHPDNDGHMVMAYLFLKEQGFTGKEVASIEIDGKKQQVINAANCEISNVKKIKNDISFDYLAQSLPYPLDTTARGWGSKASQYQVIDIVPFMDEMNQEILKVTGLKGKYKLIIDGEEIGIWSAQDFATGINMAALSNTPQYQQALKIMHLNEMRWETERIFREYAWVQFGFLQQKGLLFADNREAIEVIDANLDNLWLRGRRDMYSKMMFPEIREARQQEMDMLVKKIYEINSPVKRQITLHQVK